MKPGDLVVYKNTHRIPKPILGVILSHHTDNDKKDAIDIRFYEVLLVDGTRKLIADHYLRELNEVQSSPTLD